MTERNVRCHELPASEAPQTGRLQVGILGAIKSECLGDFVGIGSHEIATWLASVVRLSKGPNAWRAEHAQQEIAVRFGVLLSAAAVLHLFRSAPGLRSDDDTRLNPSSSSRFKERVHI